MSRLLAALYDPLTWPTERAGLGAWRRELLSPLRGRILELGAGTEANLPHYSPRVARLVVTEPDPHMRERLRRKARSGDLARTPDAVAAADADTLPFRDRSFDAVVSTLVLCSVRGYAVRPA